MVGSVVQAAGWMVILGNAGIVNATLKALGLVTHSVQLMYTPAAVIVGTTAVVMPYLILTLQSVLEGMDFFGGGSGAQPGRGFPDHLPPRRAADRRARRARPAPCWCSILCMNAYATPRAAGRDRADHDGAGAVRPDHAGVQLAIRIRDGADPGMRDPVDGLAVELADPSPLVKTMAS